MAQQQKKTGKRPDNRPARARYWSTGRLATKKVRNLIRSGYSLEDAISVWESTRKRNRDKGPGPNYSELRRYVNRNA